MSSDDLALPKCKFKAYYRDKHTYVMADSPYLARLLAAGEFGARSTYDVEVVLLQYSDGRMAAHSADHW